MIFSSCLLLNSIIYFFHFLLFFSCLMVIRFALTLYIVNKCVVLVSNCFLFLFVNASAYVFFLCVCVCVCYVWQRLCVCKCLNFHLCLCMFFFVSYYSVCACLSLGFENYFHFPLTWAVPVFRLCVFQLRDSENLAWAREFCCNYFLFIILLFFFSFVIRYNCCVFFSYSILWRGDCY